MEVREGVALSLPKGHKNTEVGVIPEDWEVKRLSEIGKFSKGSGVRKDEALSGIIPCVRYGELYTRHNDYIKQFYSYISIDVSETAKKLKFGDILFAGSGETKEEIGKSVAFIDDIEAFAGGDIVILSPENTNSLYLGYLLNATFIQKQKTSRGQGDAVVHISSTQLGNISIPLPKEDAEQTAIATALSDADALINSLEKLIAKKRNIKQGAMQQLLIPNPDSNREGWEVKKLGEIFDFKQGVQCGVESQSLTRKINQQRFIRIVDLTQPDELPRYIEDPGISHHIKNEDLFMVRYGNPGLLGFGYEGVIANNLFKLILKFKYSTHFFYHLLGFKNDAIMQLTSSTTMAALNFTALRGLMISFPKSKEEQTRIATILSDMDAEIQALESKLEKYRKIKLGMMQNLLTGKVRLV